MPTTVVGLFKDPKLVDEAVSEIAALGFPRNDVHSLAEPEQFEVRGVMSFARLDFEAGLHWTLTRIGATEAEAQAWLDGIRRGGVLVFATASDDKGVDAAAAVMNRHGALEVDRTQGGKPEPPRVGRDRSPAREGADLAELSQIPRRGPGYFSW